MMRYTLALLAVCAFGQSGRINAGGAAYTDSLGQVWAADSSFMGGAVSTGPVPAGAPAYFTSKRYGDFTYNLAVPDGRYLVGLSFLENVALGVGDRTFSVSINGSAVLTNYDIVSDVGLMATTRKTFTAIAAGHGISVKFVTVNRSSLVNAIDFSLVPVWVPDSCTFANPPASPVDGQTCVFLDSDQFKSCTGAAAGRPSGWETCRWSAALGVWKSTAVPVESPLFPFTPYTARIIECTGGLVPVSAINRGVPQMELPLFTVDGSVRWDQVMVAENVKFLPPGIGVQVSMGRPGSNDYEMTGAYVPLGESSDLSEPWTARPNPPQLSGTYSVVLNFLAGPGHLLQELTAGSVYWEACGYRVGPLVGLPAPPPRLAALESCSGSGIVLDPNGKPVTNWDCAGLWRASIVLPDGSALPLVGPSAPWSQAETGVKWTAR